MSSILKEAYVFHPNQFSCGCKILTSKQCYAKCINLSAEKEPDIFGAIKFGSILENVVFSAETRTVDYDDATLTENTRW